ncbi:uncharacterized protein [Arachis hypogaea]|uniref:uncharacterized protein n=1 Tax=Arachis hypogaea TaxID=3818 RepID=UPI000DEC4344|nr:uncharacterized protein LOC112748320 [Arachis hypogaea]
MAVESGAIPCSDEEDIMVILQKQNEAIVMKRRQSKRKEKFRRSCPKCQKQVCNKFVNDFKLCLVNLEWLDAYPNTRLRVGPRGLSDHCPLIVEDRRIAQGPRPFRSLDAWFTHEGFLRMMKEEWWGLGDVQLLDKLKALTTPLGRWHKQHFENIQEKIQKYEEEIKKVDDLVSNGVYDGTVEARRKALVRCCEVWYERQDIHWKQMSRSRHAKEMDRNTRYFHNIASARRRNNQIDSLVINGRLVRNLARIKVATRDFYRNLYHQDESPTISV